MHNLQPRYAVVVLYYRLGPALEATLERLLNQEMPPYEVILVDNNSNDGVVTMVCDKLKLNAYQGCKLTSITLEENLGYAGGMNEGISRVQSHVDFIALLTHEVLLAKNCMYQLIKHMTENESTVLAGPTLYKTNSNEIWSCGGGLDRWGRPYHRLEDPRSSSSPRWLDGACLVGRADLLKNTTQFDPTYFLYWEDVDISVRAAEIGDIAWVRSAIAHQDTSTAPPYYKSRNGIIFWRKHSMTVTIKYAAVLLAQALRAQISGRNEERADILCGVWDGINGNLNMPTRVERSST